MYFLTSSQLPTLNLACCPEARNDTNTNCWPRTRTPIFLLRDRKSGLRGVGVWALSVQFHVLILLPPSSRLRPPQASILNLLHRKQEPRSYVICIFAVQLIEILLNWGIISLTQKWKFWHNFMLFQTNTSSVHLQNTKIFYWFIKDTINILLSSLSFDWHPTKPKLLHFKKYNNIWTCLSFYFL